MSGVVGSIGSKSRRLDTRLNKDASAGQAGITAESMAGAFIDLIDRGGASNEGWMRILSDGGALKFQTLYDDASNYKQNPSVQIDATDGWFGIGSKSRFWSGHNSGTSSTNQRVPTNGCNAGYLMIGGFGYGYAGRGFWVWSYGAASAQYISHIYKSNGWGNTMNNPSLQSGYLQGDGTTFSSSYGGASYAVWGIS